MDSQYEYRREQEFLVAETSVLRQQELANALMPRQWVFFVESEIAVIGQNYENADMDNPNGDILALRYFMVARDVDGYQKRFGWAASEALAEAAFLMIAPEVGDWDDWRPVYGSRAYELEGCEREQLEAEMEVDLGVNWRTLAPEIGGLC